MGREYSLIKCKRSHETWLKIRTETNKLGKKKRSYNLETNFVTWRTFTRMRSKLMQKIENTLTIPHDFHDFVEALGFRTVVNMSEMIEAGQVCRNADVPVFISSGTNHFQQSKEDALLSVNSFTFCS